MFDFQKYHSFELETLNCHALYIEYFGNKPE